MKIFLIEKYFIWDIIGIVLFKIVLEYSYIDFVHPYFAYMGLTLDFNIVKYVEGWFIFLILFILLYQHKDHVLYISILLAFMFLIVPTITLFAFKNEPSNFFYSMMIPYTVMLLLISTKRINIYYIRHGKKIAITVSTILVGIVLVHYITTVGFRHINLNFTHEYELRSSEIGLASNSGIFGYLNSWVTQVLDIFLVSITFYRKRYTLGFLFIAIQVLLFGFSGHKAVLFSLILILGLYMFSKTKHISMIIIYSMTGAIIFLLIYFHLFDELLLPSILIRRAFFVPANLNYVYFDYFSSHDYIYWSNSILKYFMEYPYDVSPVFVIGEYLGDPTLAANTGIFGSGYMHLGIFGIILYLLIITFIINMVQQFNELPFWLINSILLMPILTIFVSSDLPTALLTHGMLICILILYLYSTPDEGKK